MSSTLKTMQNVVVGFVKSCRKHPNADRLKVCTVVLGEKLEEEIVCGAANVDAGQFVAVALPGAKLQLPEIDVDLRKKSKKSKLSTLTYKTLKVKASKIRGQSSHGMICSLRELGYCSRYEDGIWVIDADSGVDIGTPISTSLIEADTILEARKPFQQLLKDWELIGSLKEANALLAWDQHTYIPDGKASTAGRGRQISAISSLVHELSTSPGYENKLKESMSNMHYCLNTFERRSCELASDELTKAKAVPSELVAELSKLQSKCLSTWQKAKSKNEFKIVKPVFEDLLQTSIEVAKCRKQSNHETLYSSMLSDYIRGAKESEMTKLFEELKVSIVPLAKTVCEESSFSKRHNADNLLISRDQSETFPMENQKDLCMYVLKALGFNPAESRMDISAHPFTIGISPGEDVRITSRFSPYNAQTGLMAAVHEMGHAMYELNLSARSSNEMGATPVNSFLDLAAHESQSLFWERMIAQSKPFMKWLHPRLVQNLGYGTALKNSSYDDMYRCINQVSPNLIRVESDEIHYPLHVLVRYEIEKDLINGNLQVDEVPEKWNQLYHDYIGVSPSEASHGCLQDIHWFQGTFGYFPSYTLGAMYASQLYTQAEKDIENMDRMVEAGNFSKIRDWLRINVHQMGSMPTDMDSLCKDITGEGLSSEHYIQYLTNKYI